MIEGAKLEDIDPLVVKADTFLAEKHRTGTIELDRECHQRHDRRNQQQNECAGEPIEQPLHHLIPVSDRGLENVEGGDLAKIGIGAGPEAEFVVVCGQPDIDRQHPQLLQHLENARFGGNRQGEQHEVDARAPREFHDIVDLPELGAACAGILGASVVAVIEYAENAQVRIVLGVEQFNQFFTALVGSDNDRASVQSALARPAPYQPAQCHPLGNERR